MALRSRVLAAVAVTRRSPWPRWQRGHGASTAQAAQAGPGGGIPAGPATGPQSLSETGSTLLYPVLRNWAAAYRQQHANVSIATAATGSGKGIAEASAGQVDIGASDAYLSSGDLVTNPAMVNIPLAVSAQQVNYNVPGLGPADRPEAERQDPGGDVPGVHHLLERPPDRRDQPGRDAARLRVHRARAAVRPGTQLPRPGPAGPGPASPDRAGRGGQQRPPEDLGMTTEPGAAACPNCGRAVSATDNFCEGCRTELAPAAVSGDAPVAATECPACHSAQISADGYCESCGRKMPAARDHIELDLGLLAGVTDKGLRHSRNEDAMALATADRPPGRAGGGL